MDSRATDAVLSDDAVDVGLGEPLPVCVEVAVPLHVLAAVEVARAVLDAEALPLVVALA